MDKNEMVTVISTVNANLGISLPDLRFKKDWTKKGQKQLISKDMLEQIMFDSGVNYMFQNGLLYIENMKVKQELGLEPEDAQEPINIIVLNEAQMKRYLTVLPVQEFKIALESLSYEQKKNLVDYAVEHELLNFDKCEILKEQCGLDAIKMVQLNRQNKEG